MIDIDKQTIDVIFNQFWLEKYRNKDILVSDFGLKDLELLLWIRIKYLIDFDRDKLMTTLYRIDINEDAIKKIFKYSKTELIPNKIAKLIISRVAEKMENYRI